MKLTHAFIAFLVGTLFLCGCGNSKKEMDSNVVKELSFKNIKIGSLYSEAKAIALSDSTCTEVFCNDKTQKIDFNTFIVNGANELQKGRCDVYSFQDTIYKIVFSAANRYYYKDKNGNDSYDDMLSLYTQKYGKGKEEYNSKGIEHTTVSRWKWDNLSLSLQKFNVHSYIFEYDGTELTITYLDIQIAKRIRNDKAKAKRDSEASRKAKEDSIKESRNSLKEKQDI